VIAQDVASDSQRMREYCSRYPVDVLKIVPSHLTALLDAGGGKDVLPRRYLVTGGEALTPALMEKIIAAGAGCEIVNHYGPTERRLVRLRCGSRITTGRARPRSRSRSAVRSRIPASMFSDANLEPVPIGVAGELYIGGAGVASGYLDQPALTAERFLSDPFGDDPDARMYRTGDLVRYRLDGNVEFLGRSDDQVKIRGYRVELGEVEAVLARHDSVKNAIVLARADEGGDKRLVAYVVGHGAACDPGALRTYLKSQLPDYMVPAAIIAIPRIPLNANGKVDRQALPVPEEAVSAKEENAGPRTPTEEVIAAIWQEVLRRHGLGVEEDFFEIGGHSLLATQIASRLREQFRIPIAVRMIFEAPTIAAMARRVDQARREEQGMVPPPVTPVPRDRPLPLSFAQERLWVLDTVDRGNSAYNVSRTLRMKGQLNVEALERTLNEIVRRHESQRTTFTMLDGHPVQVIAPVLTLSLPIHDVSEMDEAKREEEALRIVSGEAARPFDLEHGPLVRAQLVRLSGEHHVLQLTMHHIVSDAWSAGIFFRE